MNVEKKLKRNEKEKNVGGGKIQLEVRLPQRDIGKDVKKTGVPEAIENNKPKDVSMNSKHLILKY